MTTIYAWPIIVASIVAFIIGSLWYSPFIFGKEWMRLVGHTEKDIATAKAKGGMWKSYLAQLIATIVMFGVLTFIASSMQNVSALDIALLGLFIWVGFVATMGVSGLLWEKKSLRLMLIDTVCILITLIVGGAIIGGML